MAEADEKATTPLPAAAAGGGPRLGGPGWSGGARRPESPKLTGGIVGPRPIARHPDGPMPDDTPPPIPPAEVLAWFKVGFARANIRGHPTPTLQQAEELSKILRQYQALRHDPLSPAIQRAADRIRDAAPALADARAILDEAAAIIAELPERYGKEMNVAPQAAIDTIDAILKLYPPRKRGQKANEAIPLWPTVARALLDSVCRVLDRADRRGKAGISNAEAVATYVVSKMFARVFPGTRLSPDTIARRFRPSVPHGNETEYVKNTAAANPRLPAFDRRNPASHVPFRST